MYVCCGLGIAAVFPVIPALVTDFFASEAAGHALFCEDYALGTEPDECRNAHSTAVIWTSWTSFVSNTILAFVFAPLIGDWSDRYGRKPFLLLGLGLNLVPILVILMYTYGLVPLYWYYPANASSGALSSLTVALAYVADKLDPSHRASAYGLLIASFALGFLIGPLVGAFLPVQAAMWVGAALIAGCMAYVAVLVPETVVRRCDEAVRPPVTGSWSVWMGHRRQTMTSSLVKTFRVMSRNRTFMKLAVCNAIVGLVGEGVMDLLSQYLQIKVAFTTRDQGILFAVYGFGCLVVQGALITPLVHLWGEQRLLLVGLAFTALQHAGLALCTTKGAAFAALAVGSMGSVSWPAISAIKSNNSAASEQGLVQGALVGTRSLAQGFGPLIYAAVFSIFTRTDSPVGFHPSAPFLLSCLLMVIAFLIASSIRKDAGRPPADRGPEGGGSEGGDLAPGGEGDEEALLSAKDAEEARRADGGDVEGGEWDEGRDKRPLMQH